MLIPWEFKKYIICGVTVLSHGILISISALFLQQSMQFL